jgi:serine/threonine protein kinase
MTVVYIRQLLDALIYLRNKKIIHRDLKLANLFVKDGNTIKLGDFGLATKHENANRKRKSVCGTPNYIAPEILSGDGHSFQVDNWAIGILLFAMLIGKPPFETTNMKSTYNRIQSCMYVFPPDVPINSKAKSLIMKTLTKAPNKRPTFEEMLESEYFVEITEQLPSDVQLALVAEKALSDKADSQLARPEGQKVTADLAQRLAADKKAIEGTQKSGEREENLQDTTRRSERGVQPVERQKFFKKLFTNEFKGKFGADLKTADNFSSPRTNFSKKESFKSKEEAGPKQVSRRETLKDKEEQPTKTFSKKESGNEKDLSSRGRAAEEKEFEPKILKRLMNHMANAVTQEPISETRRQQEFNSTGTLSRRMRPAWMKQGSETTATGQTNHVLETPASDKDGRSAANPDLPESAGQDGSARKISAFDIIKNSSKMNSISNTIIAEDQIRKDLETSTHKERPRYQPETTTTNKEARMEREPSVQSATSHQKKLLFQRMLENREPKQADNQVQTEEYMLPKPPLHNSGEPALPGRHRFNSVKVNDSENRLIKTLLDGNPVVSPSNADGESPFHQTSSNLSAKERQERANSAQPAIRIKSLWQPQEHKQAQEVPLEPGDYVKKWIDHSAKYGLVFIMHSGTIGILFNDMTKALFRIHGEKFVYLCRSQSKKREEVRVYALAFPPKDLEKKSGIMKDIMKTLEQHSEELKLAEGDQELVNDYKVNCTNKNRVYIKNWVKAKQVIVFKLSNGVYQAIFQDKSEILISSKNEDFIFVDKDRKRYNHVLNSDEIQKNRSVNVRVEYFKRVLKKWIERDSNSTHLPSRSRPP